MSKELYKWKLQGYNPGKVVNAVGLSEEDSTRIFEPVKKPRCGSCGKFIKRGLRGAMHNCKNFHIDTTPLTQAKLDAWLKAVYSEKYPENENRHIVLRVNKEGAELFDKMLKEQAASMLELVDRSVLETDA